MNVDLLQIAGQIWPYLLAAIVLVLALIAIIMSGVVKSSVQPAPGKNDAAAPTSRDDAPAAVAQPDVPTGPIDDSFQHARRFLQANSVGRDYRYHVPWFMVTGRVGSGKSTLLSSLGSGVLYDEAPAGLKRATGLQWRLLDQGILLDVPGVCLEREGGVPGDERSWLRFLSLLEKNRPRRPVDGVILTVPASDLFGPSALSESRLADQAARYAARLAQAQRTLGFSFPVYVVVTKCDEVEGFGSFFQEVPARCREDIFGWSSPYQLDASFTPDWVDEAFDSLTQDLQRLQSEIFVERGELEHAAEIFLFPDEFSGLRQPLRVFLGQLFREIAYRESFRFRGIFFCGDISEQPAPVPAVPVPASEFGDSPEHFETPPPPPPRPLGLRVRRERTPILVKHLLERKILPERGIARPLSRVFLARNRMVLGIQLASAILALLLGFGLTFSYRRLSSDRETLEAMLRQMLRLPRPSATGAQQSDPGAVGVNLLFAMAPAGSIQFRSAFIPASWFSTTNDNITNVMRYASEHWVLGALERSLQKRATEIFAKFSPQPDEGDGSSPSDTDSVDADAQTAETVPPAVNVESTDEYQQMVLFLNNLKELKDNAEIYERLRHRGTRNIEQDVRTLVRFLYGSDLSNVQPNGHLAQALTSSEGPPFQLDPNQREEAARIMQGMIDSLFVRWFDESLLLADVENMREKIGILEQGRSVGHQQLREALQSISQAGSDFNNAGFRWIGKESLDLNGPLGRVLYEPIAVQKNPFLQEEIRAYAIRTGQEHLTQLQDNLVKARTLMTGQLVEIKDRVVFSAGTQDLERGLQNALNLPFMVRINNHPAPPAPTLSTHLVWHVEPLQEAMRQIEIYNRFVAEGLKNEMAGLVSPLRRVALERMSQSVQDLINQSVTVETGSLAFTDEVNAVRDASEPLIQLSEALNRLGQIDIRNRMLRLVAAQGLNALTTLDDQLTSARPYAARIDNWTGVSPAALAAFAATAPADLTEYINHQREQIRFLQQQSRPFVALLQRLVPNPPQAEARRIRKWQGIIQDFDEFDQKSPTGNITLLEQFIRGDMNKITPENSCRGESQAVEAGGYLDFFVQQQARLYGSVVRRCEGLASAIVLKTYNDIAGLFNNTLAGKFPFGPLSAERNQTEAAPEDIQAFYKLLDRDGKTARSILLANVSFGASRQQAIQFLDQVQGLRPLILPTGAEVEKEPPLTLDVTPQLRINRSHETGGNQIVEWTLQIGGQIFRQNEPVHMGRWRPGNPIRLALRWAKDSTYQPEADARQPNLRALDRLVYFEFTNRWSLLAALKRQEAAPADLTGGAADLGPYTLRFRVPTAPDARWAVAGAPAPPASSVVFLHLGLNLAGTKTRATVPVFPARAPQLQTAELKE
jgi:type VI secretion system protein ImpL